MKYGFVIDNRKCIGCHAYTVACKSEHNVPVGVNRTWVKQTEKGFFPETRRVFSVTRCNHCTDAPCVEICPVEALHTREDGIVDFDNNRCIGCKTCMQACPYDSLYIDPETNTAAKCNYCAHRVDIGLEPACVVVCPEEAIISGDMENPGSKISHLISRQQVKVRKPEKSTKPNLFYIDGDEASLNPSVTDKTDQYIWNSQAGGVGHYAKFAQDKSKSKSYEQMVSTLEGKNGSSQKPIEAIMANAGVRRVYDAPDKGILWGWEVSAYVMTKAISAGMILVMFIGQLLGFSTLPDNVKISAGIVSLVFLLMTGIFLVMDLDKPTRFLYVLLRPQWNSWLTKGGYFITLYGGFVSLWIVSVFFQWEMLEIVAFYAAGIFSILVAVYTAFLFAQAKGRDFWQSPMLVLHMVTHSLMAGSALYMTYNYYAGISDSFVTMTLLVSAAFNVITLLVELFIPHPTEDAKRTASMIISGRYKFDFWFTVFLIGNILPVVIILSGATYLLAVATVLIFIGLYRVNKIWIEAPQRISLS